MKQVKMLLCSMLLVTSMHSIASAETSISALDKINGITLNAEGENAAKSYQALISAGIGRISGATTYQIGGTTEDSSGTYEMHDPISELMFPLEVYTINLDASLYFLENFNCNLSFKTNLTDETGNMEDSDWGVPWENPTGSGNYFWYGPDHLDIYSESKTDMKMYIFSLDLQYEVYGKQLDSSGAEFQLYAGLGYLYQEFEFECRLIRQVDLRGSEVPADQQLNFEGDGSVGLTYNVKSHVPYLLVSPSLILNGNTMIRANIGYSPRVMLSDRDNHILRDSISKAECRGTALLFALTGSYFFKNKVFIKAQFDYVKVNTSGKQKQYDDGAWSATIDQKNFSERKSLELSAGYLFE